MGDHKPMRKWEDNIKTDLNETVSKKCGVNSFNSEQGPEAGS
jgi:hypothetical protein